MNLYVPVFFALAVAALGNGGGYHRGGVEGVGDVAGFEPENAEKVRIVDEKLTARLGLESADVEVRYRMRNLGDRAVKVRFGFPVEESVGGTDFERSEGIARADGKLHYCQGYRIEADGRDLAAEWQGEKKPAGDGRFERIAGWLISELKFGGGEEKEVRITFRSGYPWESWFVSDDGHRGAVLFRYRLSTAAVWGGTLAKGRIELVPAGIDPADLRVIQPVNRFRKEGEKWVWQFEELEPTMADDLVVEVQPEQESYGRALGEPGDDAGWAEYVGRGGRWTMTHSNYEVRASSTLPADGELSYGAGNLREWQKAWSEGAEGAGTGEWLEFDLKVEKPVRAVLIQPGYDKSEALFRANARPKRVEVLLNGEHRFEAELRDANEEQRIAVAGYDKPVKTVRLTFKEVYPGTRYEDLCVSGLRFEVALDKKPYIRPAR